MIRPSISVWVVLFALLLLLVLFPGLAWTQYVAEMILNFWISYQWFPSTGSQACANVPGLQNIRDQTQGFKRTRQALCQLNHTLSLVCEFECTFVCACVHVCLCASVCVCVCVRACVLCVCVFFMTGIKKLKGFPRSFSLVFYFYFFFWNGWEMAPKSFIIFYVIYCIVREKHLCEVEDNRQELVAFLHHGSPWIWTQVSRLCSRYHWAI